jgi:hypothetical protein
VDAVTDLTLATPWYSTYRFYLSIGVGFSIIATMAGTGYYGAGAGAINETGRPHTLHSTERVSAMKRLDRVATKNHPVNPSTNVGKAEGKVGGDVQVESNEDADSFVKITNPARVAQEKKEEEEAEKKKQAEEAEKKKKEEEQKKKQDGQKAKGAAAKKSESPDKVEGDNGGKSETKEGGNKEGGEKSEDKGKSQAKKDNPDAKGEAGKEPTGMK